VVELASHARHDRFAVAAALGGDPRPGMIRSCPSCAALHHDLLVIRDAIRRAWIPLRPRDLSLTAEDAARLRPGRWRRIADAFGTPRDPVTRPLALTFTGLGLAGLLVTATPLGWPGQAAEPAAIEVTPYSVDVAGGSPAPSVPRNADPAPSEPARVPLLVVSGGLLGAGAGLLVARRLAGRPGPVR
jgi:hypothetical protein